MARSPLARLTTSPPRLALLVATPAIGVVSIWAVLLAITAATGRHPLWTLEPRNVAEAAAFEDGAAIIRRVRAGEDINHAGDVREHVILPEAATLTPIEAAAISGQTEMVQLLIDLGATPDDSSWQRAFCATDDDSVRTLLATRRPPGASGECASR
jgi:hypothetical protein